MSAVSDLEMRIRLSRDWDDPTRFRVVPFSERTKPPGRPSHGIGSYGVDLRLGKEYWTFDTARFGEMVRAGRRPYVMAGDTDLLWVIHRNPEGNVIVIPSRSCILAATLEEVHIPRDCWGGVMGKSTYARLFVDLNTTMIEPEWYGRPTIEISNHAPFDVGLVPGEGICQLVLTANGLSKLEKSYQDHEHKHYQGDQGVAQAKA